MPGIAGRGEHRGPCPDSWAFTTTSKRKGGGGALMVDKKAKLRNPGPMGGTYVPVFSEEASSPRDQPEGPKKERENGAKKSQTKAFKGFQYLPGSRDPAAG